jgi:hypothetical protein
MTLTITTTMLDGNARNMDRTLPRRPARRFLAFVSSLPSLLAIRSHPTTPYWSVTPDFLEDGDLHAIFRNYLWISNDSVFFRSQTHPSRSRMRLSLYPFPIGTKSNGIRATLEDEVMGWGKKGLPLCWTTKDEPACRMWLFCSDCDVDLLFI